MIARTEADSAQVRVVATEFLRMRPAIVGPFLALTVIVLVLSSAPRMQIAALTISGGLFLSFFLYERRAYRSRLVDGPTLLRSLVATVFGITVGATATGAIASPLLPMLFAPVGIGFAAFGVARRSTYLFVLLAFAVAALLTLSTLTTIPTTLVVAEPYRSVLLGAAVLDAALLLRVGVTSLAGAHERAAEALAAAGDELVDAAHARTRMLETLGSRVAHEVKNPLAAIRAIVEVMLESADERTKKRLDVAASEIARITQIVDGYGSLSHPFDVLRRAPTEVAELVDALVVVLEARAARSGVQLELVADPPLVFELDRDRVKEALLNLVLNALEATPRSGRVTIACARLPSRALELRVTDTGRGMDDATLERLGTPFFTRRSGGTGLGVAFARQVAEQHGGTLRYESALGRGTTATMCIPDESDSNEASPKERDADRPHL